MSDAQCIVFTLAVWFFAAVGIAGRKLVYRTRTRHWLQLTPETAWMVDAGHRLEYPPSATPIVLAATVLTVLAWLW